MFVDLVVEGISRSIGRNNRVTETVAIGAVADTLAIRFPHEANEVSHHIIQETGKRVRRAMEKQTKCFMNDSFL